MMTGASKPVADATIVATNAVATRWRSSASSGASRPSAAQSDTLACPACALLSVYGFVMAGASLRLIDLHVFGTALEQLVVAADREDFAFHQQHDLVVILDRSDFLRHRQQRDARVV